MNFLCDVHIPVSLSKFIAQNVHTSIHVNSVLNKWHSSDEAICQYCDTRDLVLIAKDLDFRESHLIKKTPKKAIRICLGNIPNQKLIEHFESNLKTIELIGQRSFFYLELRWTGLLIID